MPARKGAPRTLATAAEGPLNKKDGGKTSPVTARLEVTVESLQRSLELLTVEKEHLLLRQHILQEVCTATESAVVVFRTYGPQLEGLVHSGLQSATTVLVANLEQQITLMQNTLQATGCREEVQPSVEPFKGVPEAIGRRKGPGGALTMLHLGLSVLEESAQSYSHIRQLDASCARNLVKGIAEDYAQLLRDWDAAAAGGSPADIAAVEARMDEYFEGGGGATVGAVMHLIQPLFTWALGEGASTDVLLLTDMPWLEELVNQLALTPQQRAAMGAAGRVYQQLLAPLVVEQQALRKDILALLQRMEDSGIPAAERVAEQQLQEATLVQLQERLQAAAASLSDDPAPPDMLWLPGLRQYHPTRAQQQQQQQQPAGAWQQPQVLPSPDLHQQLLKLVQRSQVVLWRQSWLENCELWHMYALFSWRQFATYHVGAAGRPMHAGMLHAFVALQDATAQTPPLRVRPSSRAGGRGGRQGRGMQQQQQQQQQEQLWRTVSNPGSSGSGGSGSGASGEGPQSSNATITASSMRAAARVAAGLVLRQDSINSKMQHMAMEITEGLPPGAAGAAAAAAAMSAAAAAPHQQAQPMDVWPPVPPPAAVPATLRHVHEQQLQRVGSSNPTLGTEPQQRGAAPVAGAASGSGSWAMSISSGAGGDSGHSMAVAGPEEGVAAAGGRPEPAASDSLPQSLLDLLWAPEVDADLDVTSGAPWQL